MIRNRIREKRGKMWSKREVEENKRKETRRKEKRKMKNKRKNDKE